MWWGSAHSIDVDMLVAARAIKVCEQSYVGFEQDHGLAPAFRRAAQNGDLEVRGELLRHRSDPDKSGGDGAALFARAGGVKGTGIRDLHPEYGEVTCPFTGEVLVAGACPFPGRGPCPWLPWETGRGTFFSISPTFSTRDSRRASAAVVATVDRIAPTSEVQEAGIVIPAYRVAAVVEAPFGAHPASAYPGYAYDRAHLAEWGESRLPPPRGRPTISIAMCSRRTKPGYRDLIGTEQLTRLTRYAESATTWMSLYS